MEVKTRDPTHYAAPATNLKIAECYFCGVVCFDRVQRRGRCDIPRLDTLLRQIKTLRDGILRNTFRWAEILAMRSKYDSVKYKQRPNFRVNLSFHGTTPQYTNLSEFCSNLFRGYVIAKSSACQLTKFVDAPRKLY